MIDPDAPPEEGASIFPRFDVDAPLPADVAEPAPDAKLARIRAVIGRWMAERVHNSPVSRSTEAINHLNAQLPALASALDKEL